MIVRGDRDDARRHHGREHVGPQISEFDDQVPDTGVPVAARPLDRLDHPHRREPGQQLLEQHPQLQPGQVGTQAVVHALTETQVRIGLSGDVEDVGIVEHRASRLAEPSQICTFSPAAIWHAAQLDVARRGAALRRRRRGPAHHLLDRGRQQ